MDLNVETCTHIKIVPGQQPKNWANSQVLGVFMSEELPEFPGFFLWTSGLDLLDKPTQPHFLKLTVCPAKHGGWETILSLWVSAYL